MVYLLCILRYTEARKDREKFRKRLVEVIMHRDEWDDEDEEPGTLHTLLLYIQSTGFFVYILRMSADVAAV